MIPILDMLQTLPSFVYLIPLIFLFSVTESKLYGIAIIMYAIVPAGLGAVVMLIVAVLVNNLSKKRAYPEYWF